MSLKEKLDRTPYMTGVYSYKGNYYTAFGVVEVKNPETGKWFLCVQYVAHKSAGDETIGMYCREIDDFISKFKYELEFKSI